MSQRRESREVKVGPVAIGGRAPVSVQSMTTTPTEDVDVTVSQIVELQELGCQIIRVAVPTKAAASSLSQIRSQISIPLVADIHFEANLALEAIRQGVDKVRINPGNIKDEAKLLAVVDAAKDAAIPIRIGVNSGSIRGQDDTHADLVDLMVETVLGYCGLFERRGFEDIVLSLKASEVMATMEAYRRIAPRCGYPLHLGVTAAGPPSTAVVKSAVGIGGLLSEGIGDTLRVSLTGPPHEEVGVGFGILKALGLHEAGPEIVSCPTCGRCQVDLVKVVEQVEQRLPREGKHIRVAVMGCVVNGPGEARDCDVGIAGGKGFGFLFRRGEKVKKVPEEQMVDVLVAEATKLMDEPEQE